MLLSFIARSLASAACFANFFAATVARAFCMPVFCGTISTFAKNSRAPFTSASATVWAVMSSCRAARGLPVRSYPVM